MRKPLPYVAVGLVGLLLGTAPGCGTEAKTETLPGKTVTAEPVTNTVTVSPDAKTLASLRAKVRRERDKLASAKSDVSAERSQLRRLQSQVSGARSAAKKSTFSGTGTFAVGSDILPGTYRAAAKPGCYWARLASFDTSDINDNDNADGPVIIDVLPTDKAVQTSDCATFRKIG